MILRLLGSLLLLRSPKASYADATEARIETTQKKVQVLSQSILRSLGAKEVKRLEWLRDKPFSDELLRGKRPVVLTGSAIEAWAEQKWTSERLAEVGSEPFLGCTCRR